MALERGQVVVFGAGALGLGFLGAELAGDRKVVFVDVPSKANFLQELKRRRSYRINLAGLRPSALTVAGVDAVVSGEGLWEQQAARAIGKSDIVFTGVGQSNLDSLVPIFAHAIRCRGRRSSPLSLLHCENGQDVDLHFRARMRKACGGSLPRWFRSGKIVAGRMCRTDAPGGRLKPLFPGSGTAIVAEPFYGIPVGRDVVLDRNAFGPAFQIQPAPVFAMLDDIKLFAHNGCHALLGYLGHLKGYKRYPELARDGELMQLAYRMVFDELEPALRVHHRSVFDRSSYRNYAVALLGRLVSPSFDDPIERGIRNPAAKLSPEERLVSGARFVLSAGGMPEMFSLVLAAAIIVSRRRRELAGGMDSILTRVCRLTAKRDAKILRLVGAAVRRLRKWHA